MSGNRFALAWVQGLVPFLQRQRSSLTASLVTCELHLLALAFTASTAILLATGHFVSCGWSLP